ncbi:general amino acid permease [Moniliophthora roreri MCA 2997]|uniref:General amino acid permease n=1 Tax=Moniliophthora roreri (strain MCA 2997) TaxID=1381753 RepID=V2WLE3_MONRO|nr:general amino acid permease [Moniliophthora roreri MCA 2997]
MDEGISNVEKHQRFRTNSASQLSKTSGERKAEYVEDEDSKLRETPLDATHRTLSSRHIQLIGIGGSIGTAIFVQIGAALTHGGPGSLFVAFAFWSTVVLALNNSLSEMVTWMPISSPFIRFAEHFVDPALGFIAAVNFFVNMAINVPFEITAFNLTLHFWTDRIPIVAVIFFVLLCYILLNIFAVKLYGEAEFWLALGKVLLALGLIFFTFIVMVGGNPLHDAFGFRNWNPSHVPGSPFAEYVKTGSTGRFMGFLTCLVQAAFTIEGPEFISMTAGEAANPRLILPKTFRRTYARLLTFFVLGSLCVGILVPYNDPNLLSATANPQPGAGSSPYVIAMRNLRIGVLPHIVNALVMLSIFSAGNNFLYCASRILYGMALENQLGTRLSAKLRWCTRAGAPIWCVLASGIWGLLALLGVSNTSAVVLQWFADLITVSYVFNYFCIALSYLRFFYALKAQNISRDSLPHKGPWQPLCGYYALTLCSAMIIIQAYSVFMSDQWDIPTVIFVYALILALPLLFVLWKTTKRTKVGCPCWSPVAEG